MIHSLSLHTPSGQLYGQLACPPAARALILLAHTQHTAVDSVISANLATRGYAILAMSLLTAQESQFVDATQNVPRLSQRLIEILDFARNKPELAEMPIGIFATGDASPAAIRAAAQRDTQIQAVVCHGGLIDRAGRQALDFLAAPLLTLFDPDDVAGKNSCQLASHHLSVAHETHVLSPAEDPVIRVAAWFGLHLRA